MHLPAVIVGTDRSAICPRPLTAIDVTACTQPACPYVLPRAIYALRRRNGPGVAVGDAACRPSLAARADGRAAAAPCRA